MEKFFCGVLAGFVGAFVLSFAALSNERLVENAKAVIEENDL